MKDFEKQVGETATRVAANKQNGKGRKVQCDDLVITDPISLIYENVKSVELVKVKTSFNFSELENMTAEDLEKFKSKTAKEIEDANKKNHAILLDAYLKGIEDFSFASIEERELFIKRFNHAKEITKDFTLTFSDTKPESGLFNTYENGAFYSRNSDITAFGLKTSYNSVRFTLRTAAELAAKQARQKAVEDAKTYLLSIGTPSVILDNMQDGVILSTYEKLTKADK